jgi:hypothetical protein
MNAPSIRHYAPVWLVCVPLFVELDEHIHTWPMALLATLGAFLLIASSGWFIANRWELVAWLVSRPPLRDLIIHHAYERNVYLHIPADTGAYMERRWLVNVPVTQQKRRWRLPFEVRVHHIKRPDRGRDPHDHPWNWRTIVMRGWYDEVVDGQVIHRAAGTTAGKRSNDAHHISAVAPGGVWTLFIVGPYRQKWGFHTPTGKVPYDQYDARDEV